MDELYTIFVRDFNNKSRCLPVTPRWSLGDLKSLIQESLGIRSREQVLLASSKPCLTGKDSWTLNELGIHPNTTLCISGRLRGGKGGFGSLLRGSAKSTTTENDDACRDLSGRRLRVKNSEEKLREWRANEKKRQGEVQAAKEERERQRAEKRAEKTEEVLGNIRKEQSGVAASLAKAMQSSQFTGQKRDLESKVEKPAKKRRFRDESEDDDSDIDSEDSDSEEAKAIQKDQVQETASLQNEIPNSLESEAVILDERPIQISESQIAVS